VSDKQEPNKSLLEEIIDKTLCGLEDVKEFGPEIVKQLREIAASGDIKKAAVVAKIIKS